MSGSLISVHASQLDKPNRLTEEKDEKYHARYAKYAISTVAAGRHNDFVRKTQINKSFYMGQDNQWLFEEDLEPFLNDDTNTARNRIKVVNNIIRPLVEQYRGNANRLQINATAKSISNRVRTRREAALEEQLFFFDLTQEVPAFSEVIKKNRGVGDTVEETQEIFHNMYVDRYVSTMNKLLQYVAELNEFYNMQIKVAENLALSGLCVVEGEEHGGHMRFEVVESEEFIYDRSAKKYDLSDSDFQGKASYMLPTNVYERYHVEKGDAEAIEKYVEIAAGLHHSQSKGGATGNASTPNIFAAQGYVGPKVPVFKIYWRDVDRSEWGYVVSEFGYKKLVRINHTEEGEEEPRYTDADLIEPPNTPKNTAVFKGRNKAMLYTDVLRYCIIIPSEVLSSSIEKQKDRDQISDVILDWGQYYYQEVELQNHSNVKFPFKCYTWGYIDGNILSPVDDAISPQRLINRVLSITEAQINSSGGSNIVIDEDTIDPQHRDSIERDIKASKPIMIKTKGIGIPNSIGFYDNTPKAGTYGMFELIPIMRDLVQSSTGVNEPLQGQTIGSGSDQLVGVTERLIERGSLMQEPFYKAVEMIFTQMYQMTATIGKKIYADNERELIIAVGDEDAEMIKISRDFLNEDFRVFIKRDSSQEALESQANGLLGQLMELQLIDDKFFANFYNRSTPNEVIVGLRKFASVKIEAQKALDAQAAEQAEQQQIGAEADLAVASQQQQRAEQIDTEKFKADLNQKENESILKAVTEGKKQANGRGI